MSGGEADAIRSTRTIPFDGVLRCALCKNVVEQDGENWRHKTGSLPKHAPVVYRDVR